MGFERIFIITLGYIVSKALSEEFNLQYNWGNDEFNITFSTFKLFHPKYRAGAYLLDLK